MELIKKFTKFITKHFKKISLILITIFNKRELHQHHYLSDPQATKLNVEATLISCYDINSENKSDPFVPVSNTETFLSGSVYFLETSCKGSINSRQACCVESAARSNPGRQVNLIFIGIVTEPFIKSPTLQSLLQFRNVRISKIYPTKYVKGTSVESLFARKDLRKSRYFVEHNSDVLRILTLYKHGGIYLDTDVIVTKSFDTLPKNWLAKENKDQLGSAILSFSKDKAGKDFTAVGLQLLNATYDPTKWEYNGPLLMSRILSQKCSTGDVTKMNETTCPGIAVLEPKNFYPFPWWEWKKYFEPYNGNRSLDEPYTYHFNNKFSKNTKITNDSLIAKLAKIFCPNIYNLNQLDFGN